MKLVTDNLTIRRGNRGHGGRSINRWHRGVTLIEMLISVTLTLLVVFAVVQIFELLGDTVALGRATIEMSGQLRTVSNHLQQDLDGITCSMQPPNDPASGGGYFVYFEGPGSDATNLTDANNDGEWDGLAHLGDADDMLAMTVHSSGKPFSGRVWIKGTPPTLRWVESPVAEVVWWVATIDQPGQTPTRVLLRRTFLVVPWLDASTIFDPHSVDVNGVPTEAFFKTEVALHKENGVLVTSSLSDLTTPGKRCLAFYGMSQIAPDLTSQVKYLTAGAPSANSPVAFPVLISPDDLRVANNPGGGAFGTPDPSPGDDLGEYAEYLVVSDLLAFDVRAYDPEAPLLRIAADSIVALSPGDPGFIQLGLVGLQNAIQNPNGFPQLLGRGAFVDLAYMVNRQNLTSGETTALDDPARISPFSGLPLFRNVPPLKFYTSIPVNPVNNRLNGLPGGLVQTVPLLISYDTWSAEFERDGLSQDDDSDIDEGRNGLDDDNENGVDDAGELESPPPYPVPLRGLEVRIRMWDVSTGQVRQVSVVGDFSSK